jgi:hypothetical protein
VSLYHLQARLIEGPLSALTRDETQSRESDDWGEIVALGDQLAKRGFTVWIYDHGHEAAFPTASDFRVISRMQPTRTASTRTGSAPRPPR